MRRRQIGQALWPKSLRNDVVAEKGLNFGHAGVWSVGYRCKSIGRWGTLNWIFPAGWSDIPHVTRQHGRNSVLFRRPHHFEGTLATALARSNAASLFLMGISERESLPNKPRTIDTLKANFTKEIQAVTVDILARTFQNMARRVQSCLDANVGHFQHVMMSSHFSQTNVLLFKFRYIIFIGVRIMKEMPGLVGSGTLSQHFTNNFSLHTTLTFDTVMNRERPTFVGFCSSIPTCVIISSTFFMMGNREFLHCLSLLPQGKSKTGIFQRLSKTA